MTTDITLWMIGQAIMIMGVGLTAYISLIQRVTRVETAFDMMGKKAARSLHSPDDHLGLDALLDKYISRHYELSIEEWQQLHDKCDAIIDDKSVQGQERALAAIVAAVAEHKMMGFPSSAFKRLDTDDKFSDTDEK